MNKILPQLQDLLGKLRGDRGLQGILAGSLALLIASIGLEAWHDRSHTGTQAQVTTENESEFGIDTQIPAGFVLVPIQIQNTDALAGLMDHFAIVDLYAAEQPALNDGKRMGSHRGSQRIGRHLRLLRAPLNPNVFAVLVPEAQAQNVLSVNGPVQAVLKNRSEQSPAKIDDQKNPKGSSIQYYRGSNP